MADEAGAGTAAGDATSTTTTTAPAPAGAQGATPGVDDRGAEDLLTEALNSTDTDLSKGDDLAAQVAALQKQNAALQKHGRTWETRAKENTDAAKRLAELEEAGKTEAQKLADRAAAAEQRAAEVEGRYHRTLAAATYGLPPELIDVLGGGTEDEVNASAEALASVINSRVAEQVAAAMAASAAAAGAGANGAPAPQQPAAPRRPVESMRAGATPAGQGPPRTGSDWFRQQLAVAQNHA